MLDTFNGYNPPKKTKSLLASTRGELEKILADPEFAKAEQIQLLEVVMGRQDAPEALIKQGKLVSRPPRLLPFADVGETDFVLCMSSRRVRNSMLLELI